MTGRETFFIQLPFVDDSSSGPAFEFGIAASPYSGTLCIFGGKFAVPGGAAAAVGAGVDTAGKQASTAQANRALKFFFIGA